MNGCQEALLSGCEGAVVVFGPHWAPEQAVAVFAIVSRPDLCAGSRPPTGAATSAGLKAAMNSSVPEQRARTCPI